VSGVATSQHNCFDVLLADDFKFCYGVETTTLLGQTAAAFPNVSPYTPKVPIVSLYFMRDPSMIYANTVDFNIMMQPTDVMTDFVTDRNTSVYAVANYKGKPWLFQFSPWLSAAKPIALVPAKSILGLAISTSNTAYVLYSGTSAAYSLRSIDLAAPTALKSSHTLSIDCTSYQSSGPGDSSSLRRMISLGDDGYIYVLCTKDTTRTTQEGPNAATDPYFRYRFQRIYRCFLTKSAQISARYDADIVNLRDGGACGLPLRIQRV